MGRTWEGGSRGSGNHNDKPTRVVGKDREAVEPELLGAIEGPKQTSTGGTTAIRDHEQQGKPSANPQEDSMELIPSMEDTLPKVTRLMEEPNKEN